MVPVTPSLFHLRDFRGNYIKIDKSFVFGMSNSSVDRNIVECIVDMAHNMNMEIIAEGVETQEHFDYLRSINCDFIQGYLISEPVPSHAIIQELTDQKGVLTSRFNCHQNAERRVSVAS